MVGMVRSWAVRPSPMGSSPLGSSVSSSLHHVNPFPDICFILMTGPAPTVGTGNHSTRMRIDPIVVKARIFNKRPRITPWGFIGRLLN
jgi:hypothetical protein